MAEHYLRWITNVSVVLRTVLFKKNINLTNYSLILIYIEVSSSHQEWTRKVWRIRDCIWTTEKIVRLKFLFFYLDVFYHGLYYYYYFIFFFSLQNVLDLTTVFTHVVGK